MTVNLGILLWNGFSKNKAAKRILWKILSYYSISERLLMKDWSHLSEWNIISSIFFVSYTFRVLAVTTEKIAKIGVTQLGTRACDVTSRRCHCGGITCSSIMNITFFVANLMLYILYSNYFSRTTLWNWENREKLFFFLFHKSNSFFTKFRHSCGFWIRVFYVIWGEEIALNGFLVITKNVRNLQIYDFCMENIFVETAGAKIEGFYEERKWIIGKRLSKKNGTVATFFRWMIERSQSFNCHWYKRTAPAEFDSAMCMHRWLISCITFILKGQCVDDALFSSYLIINDSDSVRLMILVMQLSTHRCVINCITFILKGQHVDNA